MVIAGSNTTSIRAVDAANSRSTAKDESSSFQLNINGELDRES